MKVLKFYNLQDQEVGSVILQPGEADIPTEARLLVASGDQIKALESRISLALIRKIDDAPKDGKLYARRNGAWEVIPGASEHLKVK